MDSDISSSSSDEGEKRESIKKTRTRFVICCFHQCVHVCVRERERDSSLLMAG